MIILVIPILFALVVGLACMGPFGWLALAGALEFFGWVTTPKCQRVRKDSPTNAIAKVLLCGFAVYLVFGLVYGALSDPHFIR